MSLLDFGTGGKSGEADKDQELALQQLLGVEAPTKEQLSLPDLEQYALAQNMTPAQMQAFLQSNNALSSENVDQTGTAAQQAALSQLSDVANAGASGTPIEQAQIADALQKSNTNLAGQRGSIEQAAEARGVPVGLLQAALSHQAAGQDAQNANQAALQAQSQAYQTALNAAAQRAGIGSSLQGQQNTQANTVAQAQNAMQQFNAANQQQASANNATLQQQANAENTQAANRVSQANTGLKNQKTGQNVEATQQSYNDALQKAMGVAGQYGNMANQATQQGNENLGIMGALTGASGSFFGISPSGGKGLGSASSSGGSSSQAPAPSQADSSGQDSSGSSFGLGSILSAAHGGIVPTSPSGAGEGYCQGGPINMKSGGPVPGRATVPGDSPKNDTVLARVSPGEVIVSRDAVAAHPEDVATLLAAMKHLRGGQR